MAFYFVCLFVSFTLWFPFHSWNVHRTPDNRRRCGLWTGNRFLFYEWIMYFYFRHCKSLPFLYVIVALRLIFTRQQPINFTERRAHTCTNGRTLQCVIGKWMTWSDMTQPLVTAEYANEHRNAAPTLHRKLCSFQLVDGIGNELEIRPSADAS